MHHYELKLQGAFNRVLVFMDYLDHLSRFATVTRLVLSVDEESGGDLLIAECRFSILISDEPSSAGSETSFEVNFDPIEKNFPTPFLIRSTEQVESSEPVLEDVPPEIHVTGIIAIRDEYRAIVEQQILKQGDAIGDSIIKEIEKDKLIVATGNKLYEIPVR